MPPLYTSYASANCPVPERFSAALRKL
jgi:hypothetical protein